MNGIELDNYKIFLDKMVEDGLIQEYKFDFEESHGLNEEEALAVAIKPVRHLDWVYMEFSELENTLPEKFDEI